VTERKTGRNMKMQVSPWPKFMDEGLRQAGFSSTSTPSGPAATGVPFLSIRI